MLKYSLEPSANSLDGLVERFGLTGKTYASSTNINKKRTNNPINRSESDRWCSLGTDDVNERITWKIVFDKHVCLTNYSIISNLENSSEFRWFAEGKGSRGWTKISVISEKSLVPNKVSNFPTTNHGPFSAFRITTTQNGYSTRTDKYWFCLLNVDFYGFIIGNSLFVRTCAIKRKSTFFLYLFSFLTS